MKRASAAVLAAVVLTCAGGEVRGQLLAYEGFEPVVRPENWLVPVGGTQTVSNGFLGGWEVTGEPWELGLWRSPYWSAWSPVVSSGWVMAGWRSDARLGRRLDLGAPGMEGYRTTREGPATFGKPGTEVWVGFRFHNTTDIYDPTRDWSTWDGRTELVLHRSADVTSLSVPVMSLANNMVRGITFGVAASASEGVGVQTQLYRDGWWHNATVAVGMRYGEGSTRVEVYVNPALPGAWTEAAPVWVEEVKAGDPRAPDGILAWDAVSFRPTQGTDTHPGYGRMVAGSLQDLRVGGSFASVLPTNPASLPPTWVGPAEGGRWEDPANWSNGKAPTTVGDSVALGPSAVPVEVRVDTQVEALRVRFDSDAPYKLTGRGALAVTSATDSWYLGDGYRQLDVRRGRHEIDVPVAGQASELRVTTRAETFLSIRSVAVGKVVVTGAGTVEVKDGLGARAGGLNVEDTAKVVARSEDPSEEALRQWPGAYPWYPVEVKRGATLVLGVPGRADGFASIANLRSLMLDGSMELEDVRPGTRPALLTVVGMNIRGGGRLDVGTNLLRAGVDPWETGETIETLIAKGRNGGDWSGAGVTSRAAGGLVSLGAATSDDNEDLFPLTGGWGPVVALTYVGDTNLDGVVDDTDLARLMRGLGGERWGWAWGDFDYSGTIDAADVGLYWAGRSGQGRPLGLSAVVPEAGWAGVWVGVGGLAVAARVGRRRR